MCLTHKDDVGSFQSLDYMFEIYIDKDDYNEREINKKLFLVKGSPLIEEFLIEDRPYSQLSDHLGLSIELSYKDKNMLENIHGAIENEVHIEIQHNHVEENHKNADISDNSNSNRNGVGISNEQIEIEMKHKMDCTSSTIRFNKNDKSEIGSFFIK